MNNKDLLKVIGFPRSGNTFLNFALQAMYYPNKPVNDVNHIGKDVLIYNKSIVPLRNPIDAITSWHLYANNDSKVVNFSTSISYYTGFHLNILNNINKVKILDFNIFTNNLIYVENNIFDFFNIKIKQNISIDQIKKNMVENNKKYNLPNNNKQQADIIKNKLKKHNRLEECFNIYNKLKNI